MNKNFNSVKGILALKLGGIGDVLTITPALRTLKKRWPQARITVVVERQPAEMLKGLPYLDEIIVFDDVFHPWAIKRLLSHEILKATRAIFRIILTHYDIYIEFHNLFSTGSIIKPMLFACLSGAPYRIGLDTYHRGFFLTHRVKDNRFKFKHQVERFLDVVEVLGADTKDKATEILISDGDRSFAQKLLRRAGRKIPSGPQFKEDLAEEEVLVSPGLLVGIHPGANPNFLHRCAWPAERFAEIADKIVENYQAQIVLTGSQADSSINEEVYRLMRHRPLNLSGQTTINQLAAVIQRCHLFISNDTGPMHVAVAMKVPTIGIFGPGDYQAYGSYPQEANFTLIREKVDCWPCRNLRCWSRKCMEVITVEKVWQAVQQQIERFSIDRDVEKIVVF